MLVGYVSDERYVALADVLLEFESASGSVESRSRATGAVYAELAPGRYRVTLQKPGYGAKLVAVHSHTPPIIISRPLELAAGSGANRGRSSR